MLNPQFFLCLVQYTAFFKLVERLLNLKSTKHCLDRNKKIRFLSFGAMLKCPWHLGWHTFIKFLNNDENHRIVLPTTALVWLLGNLRELVEHNKLPNTKGPAAIVWAHKSYTREILFFGVFDLLKIRNDILTFLRKGTSIQRNSKMVLSGGLPHRSHASSWESLVCISLSYLIAECRLLLLVFFGYSCFFLCI